MKLQEVQIMDVDTIGSVDEDISLKVDTTQSVKLFNILIESYKNSRSSMIREYVSNAWDAHKEIGKTNIPVIVRISEDDGGQYLEIIDEGVGMTKEFFLSVYSTLLATTKDGANDQIGGFGIGSKTALAYTNFYYVTTTKDGETNEFAIYRESTRGVKISLLQTLEADEGVSGTRVKIYLLDRVDEESKIIQTVIKELVYFDNVVIENAFNLNDNSVFNYNNNPIIESDLFKYKTSTTTSDESFYDRNIHLAIGNVAYSIDYKMLGQEYDNSGYKFRIPVALKFNIGELKVHMNRESIIYDDDTINLIKSRLEEVREYFTVLHTTQRKKHNCSTLLDYIKELKEYYNNDYVAVNLTERHYVILPTKSLNINKDDVIPKFKLFEILQLKGLQNQITKKIYDAKYNSSQELYKTVVSNENIINTHLYFVGEIASGKFIKRVHQKNITNWNGKRLVIISSDAELTAISKDKYALKYFRDCFIIRDNLINKKDRNRLLRYDFDWIESSKINTRKIKVETDVNRHIDEVIDIQESYKYVYKRGNISSILAFIKFVRNELLSNCTIIQYSKFKTPKQFIDEIKQQEREARGKVYRAEGTIPIRSITENWASPANPNATIKEFDLATLNTFKGILVYGTKNDREYLGKAACLLQDRYKELGYRKQQNVYRVIQISEANQQPFTKFKNAVNVRILFMSSNKLIIELYTSYIINQKYEHVFQSNMSSIRVINSEVHNQLLQLRQYSDRYYRSAVSTPSIMKEIQIISKLASLIDVKVADILSKVDKYFEDIEFITTSTIVPGTEENIVKILKKLNKKVDWNWYHKPTQPPAEALVTVQRVTRFMAYEPTDLLNYDKSLKPIEINKYCLTIK